MFNCQLSELYWGNVRLNYIRLSQDRFDYIKIGKAWGKVLFVCLSVSLSLCLSVSLPLCLWISSFYSVSSFSYGWMGFNNFFDHQATCDQAGHARQVRHAEHVGQVRQVRRVRHLRHVSNILLRLNQYVPAFYDHPNNSSCGWDPTTFPTINYQVRQVRQARQVRQVRHVRHV